MNRPVRAHTYDLMKLIVTILLLLLFLFLLWKGNAATPVPTLTPLPPGEPFTATPAIATDTPPSEPSATARVAVSLTSTPPPPEPSLTATTTSIAASTHTPESGPTIATAVAPLSAIPTVTTCDQAMAQSQLQTGMQATIVRRLNFRSSPGIQENWIWTNNPGTKVEIIDGPVCLPHHVGAYIWWQIRLPDGRIGWSAEASLQGTFYFMEPKP